MTPMQLVDMAEQVSPWFQPNERSRYRHAKARFDSGEDLTEDDVELLIDLVERYQ